MSELVERLAREAGIKPYLTPPKTNEWHGYRSDLEKFAALVAEECAKVCEELGADWRALANTQDCADAIRAKFGGG